MSMSSTSVKLEPELVKDSFMTVTQSEDAPSDRWSLLPRPRPETPLPARTIPRFHRGWPWVLRALLW